LQVVTNVAHEIAPRSSTLASFNDQAAHWFRYFMNFKKA